MSGRSPIFSAKHVGQQIGYIEDDQAFDLFARRRAAYDCETGLLRDLTTQATVGYVTLKGIFVGASSSMGELFPSVESGFHAERGKNDGDDGDAEALAAAPTGTSEESGAEKFDASGGNIESVFSPCPVEVDHTGMLTGEHDPIIPREVSPQEHPSNDQTLINSVPDETPRTSFCDFDFESHQARSPREQRPNNDGVLVGDEHSLQCQPAPISPPPALHEDIASAALSEPREGHLECSRGRVDQNSSGALLAVENFMHHLAEYVSSTRDRAEIPSELSSRDEIGQWPSSSADAHDDPQQKELPDIYFDAGEGLGRLPFEHVSVPDEPLPSTLVDPCHNDNGSLQGEDPVVVNEAATATWSEQHDVSQATAFEFDAPTAEDGAQGRQHLEVPATGKAVSSSEIGVEQAAGDFAVNLKHALEVVRNELERRKSVMEASDPTGECPSFTVRIARNEIGKQEHPSEISGDFPTADADDPELELGRSLDNVLSELEKKAR
jgi:hypothetical protein